MIHTRKPCKILTVTLVVAWVVCSVTAFIGCGSSGPRAVPVQGKITYHGGAWPKPGVLYFSPAQKTADGTQRPVIGHFDVDGTITLGNGLMPGIYRIGVECWEVPPTTMNLHKKAQSYVPAKFQSVASSGLEIEVKSNACVVAVDIDISGG